MRDGRCPKCGCQEVARTEIVLYLGAAKSGPTLELFVCADCRYVEPYLLGSVREKVSILDAWTWVRTDEGGPFRR